MEEGRGEARRSRRWMNGPDKWELVEPKGDSDTINRDGLRSPDGS